MPEEIGSPAALKEKLQEILVKGSLYRNFLYQGRNCHFTARSATAARYGELFKSSFIQARCYTCRNCGENRAHYPFIWQENAASNLFVKVGQWPPLAIEPSPELAKALGPHDAELYKKALINANFSHGLGAVAYFRRVLENKVNVLLDLMVEAVRNAQGESAILNQLSEIKNSHRGEDKIAFASELLPANLRPGGHNPLDKLYTAASAGLHGESDDESMTSA